MKRLFLLITLSTLLVYCDYLKSDEVKTLDLNGNWYLGYGRGPIDTTINYVEFYIKDSLLNATDENAGQSPPKRILIKGDSIYFSRGNDLEKLFPFYKVLRLKHDTLWVRFNPSPYSHSDTTIFWVRLPANEKGFYDHAWSKESRDSLLDLVYGDYRRRMWRHHYFRHNDIDTYDSLIEAGYWD